MPVGQIDVGDARAVPRELREVGPDAAADLEHLLPGVARKLHHLQHPRRVRAVPVALDLQKPFERLAAARRGPFQNRPGCCSTGAGPDPCTRRRSPPARIAVTVGVRRKRPEPFDVPPPRIVIGHRLSRIAPERAAAISERRTRPTTPSTNSSTSPGVHRTERCSPTTSRRATSRRRATPATAPRRSARGRWRRSRRPSPCTRRSWSASRRTCRRPCGCCAATRRCRTPAAAARRRPAARGPTRRTRAPSRGARLRRRAAACVCRRR